MQNWSVHLARLIGERRIKKGKLAKDANIDPATLSQILNDDSYEPGVKVLMRLADALHVDVGELLRDPNASTSRVSQAVGPPINWSALLHKVALAFEEAIEVAERDAHTETAETGTDESGGTKAG